MQTWQFAMFCIATTAFVMVQTWHVVNLQNRVKRLEIAAHFHPGVGEHTHNG